MTETETLTKRTFVRWPEGTTTCCGAYTSIFEDDGVEYCKACFDAVEDYIDTPATTITIAEV